VSGDYAPEPLHGCIWNMLYDLAFCFGMILYQMFSKDIHFNTWNHQMSQVCTSEVPGSNSC